MAIASVLETLEGVDEALKSLYVEADGKFHLDLDDTIRDHPGVQPLRKAYDAEKAAAAEAKAAAKKAKDDLASALKDKPDADALVKLRDELEGKINALTTENDGLKGQLTGVTRDRALADALTGAGVTNPTFQKAATAMLAGAVKLVDGKAIVETDMGPVDVAQHVKRWAASEGKDFVTPPAGGGSKGQDNGDKTKVTGNMSGSPEERVAAIKAKMEAEQ